MRYLAFLLFAFDGRIGRRAFWLGSLIAVLASGALSFAGAIFDVLFGTPPIEGLSFFQGMYPISTIAGLLPFYSSMAVTVKRLHDRNKGAKWLLVQVIPILGTLWLILEIGFLPGSRGENDWGTDPRELPAAG